VKKKAGKRTTLAVRNLSARPLAGKQAGGVKGGTKFPGSVKTSDITLKRG